MPESCWESCITTPIMSGALSVGEQISSIILIDASACWALSSALISSISSSTWLLALNLLNAFRASSSHCLVMSRYLGLSGHIGSKTSCNKAGQTARPSNRGQPSFVPRICSIPSTWDSNRPTVTANWLTVPKPPRKFNGAISDIYIGTKDVFNPENNIAINEKDKFHEFYCFTAIDPNNKSSQKQHLVRVSNFCTPH